MRDYALTMIHVLAPNVGDSPQRLVFVTTERPPLEGAGGRRARCLYPLDSA